MLPLLQRRFASSKTALVLNCGSSSVKYQLFEGDDSLMRGSLENIGLKTCIHKISVNGNTKTEDLGGSSPLDYPGAIKKAFDSAMSLRSNIYCVGHRVVHGGPFLTRPTVINSQVLEQIRDCCKLAPLHNPGNLQGIELAADLLRTVPQVACFDTAFHARIPFKAHMYGIPRDIAHKMSIRRYGFHGLSYAYISSVVEEKRIVVAHLGSGCSASAIVNGVSVDTTMGFTPMEGLMMSTRSGSIDPGVILHIAREYGGDLELVSQILNKKSGLLGVSGITSDMKELLEIEKGSDDHKARYAHQAVEVFVYTVQKFISQLVMALNYDVDAVVFTGGIGENSPEIRARVMSAFSNLGVLIDPYRNSSVPENRIISMKQSKIKVMSIPTNEEQQIARDSVCAVDPNA